ncbi:hypothetical protein VV11_014255 [Trichodesmium erythraeum 21-75]|nr:hypothetical protein [Trichodesmium erythraeum 21-75]
MVDKPSWRNPVSGVSRAIAPQNPGESLVCLWATIAEVKLWPNRVSWSR